MLSRDEWDASGALEWREVEELFQRTGEVWEVEVEGRLIRTTGEHPFYGRGGWTPLRDLAPGQAVLDRAGVYRPITRLSNTQTYEPVYNIRVAQAHTYFVGAQGWPFDLWVHNATCEVDDVIQAGRKNGIELNELQAEHIAKLHNEGAWGAKRGVKAELESIGIDEISSKNIFSDINKILNDRDSVSGTEFLRDAKVEADSVRDNSTNKTRPQAISVIESTDGIRTTGKTITELEAYTIEPVVAEQYRLVPPESRSRMHHGECSEVMAMSELVRAGGNLRKAKLTCINLDGPRSTSGRHGLVKSPCESCKYVIEQLEIQFVRD